MATRVKIPAPPWEQKEEEDKIIPPPWESSAQKAPPPPPWERNPTLSVDDTKNLSDQEIRNRMANQVTPTSVLEPIPVARKTFPEQAVSGIRKVASEMVRAPITAGEKIVDVAERGREIDALADRRIDEYVSDPSAEYPTGRAAVGALAQTALDFFPPTVEGQAENAAMAAGLGFAGKAGLGLIAKKYPNFFAAISKNIELPPAVKGNINYFFSELKGKLGIPQERGLQITDIRKSLAEGKLSPAQAARMDKAIYDEMWQARQLKPEAGIPTTVKNQPVPRETITLSEPESRIYFQDPATKDVFYDGIKIAKDGFAETSPRIQAINKIDNEIRALKDLGTSRSAPDKFKQQLPARVSAAKKALVGFVQQNMPGNAAPILNAIEKADLPELPTLSQRISREFIRTVADPVQPKEPGVLPTVAKGKKLPEITPGPVVQRPVIRSIKRPVGSGGIVNFVVNNGRINPKAIESSDIRQIGQFRLLNTKSGKSLDHMTELAIESGFLPRGSTGSDLIKLIDKEVKTGNRQLPASEEHKFSAKEEDILAARENSVNVAVGDLDLKVGDKVQYVDKIGVHDAEVTDIDEAGNFTLIDGGTKKVDVFDTLKVVDIQRAGKTEAVKLGGKTQEQGLLPGTPGREFPKTALAKSGQDENVLGNFAPEEPITSLFSGGGTATKGTTPRIEPAPISGVEPKTLNQITADLGKGLKSNIFYGKPNRGAGGTYYPGSGALVVRFSGDLDTTAHEISHKLDDQFGILKEWAQPGMISPFDKELAQFWPHGSVRKSGPKSKLSYKRAEGVAEYLRAMIVNPKAAEQAAPQFTKFIKSKLPAEVWTELGKFSDDVRAFAGANAHQKIMSNVRWEPPKETIAEKLAGGNVGPDFKLTAADRMLASWQDSLQAFTKSLDYVKGIRGVDKLLPANDPELLARVYMGNLAKVEDILENGMIDFEGNRVIDGGIKKWLDSLDRSTSKSLDKESQEVASYMIAQRTIEKAKQLGRSNVSGIGGGIDSDVNVAEARLKELADQPELFKRIKIAAEAYREHADALLKYLVESGRMSKESYDWIKANNEYYVAMQRFMEVEPGQEIVHFRPSSPGGKKIGVIREPVKKFKGSAKTIENPFLSLIDNTIKAIAEGDRNNVMRQFRDLLTTKRGFYGKDFADVAQVGRLAKEGDKNTIPIYVDGKREIWQFQEDVYKALKGIDDAGAKLPGWSTIAPKILRATITNAPPFAVRNVIRDAFERSIRSRTGSNLADSFKKQTPMELSNLRKFGGDQFGHYLKDKESYSRAMKTAMNEIAEDKGTILVDPKRLWNAYSEFVRSSEYRGRVAEYNKAFDHGKNVLKYDDYNAGLYAASQARGILDFAVSGSMVKTINQLIPFTNAAIQGLTANIKSAKEDPKKFAGKWFTYIVVPVLFERLVNMMIDEKRYDQLPAYRKDFFWNIPIGEYILSIPKPFELGVLASGVGRAFDAATGDKKAFDGYGGSLAKSLLPVDESAIGGPFRGVIQAMANYDFFRNKNIVPPHEERLDLDLRNNSSASNAAKVMQRLVGVDARKIDFLMRDQLGYAGKFAADLSDIPTKGGAVDLALSQTGLVSSYPVYASRDVQWVFDMAKRRGLTANPRYKGLNLMLNKYFDANGDEKQEITDKILKYARETRNVWEKSPAITQNRKLQEKVKRRRK